MTIDYTTLWEDTLKTAPAGQMPRCFGEAVLAASRAGVDCDTKALRDALEAGPTDGPWQVNHSKAYQVCDADGEVRGCSEIASTGGTNSEMKRNAAYISAANPATIRALLARLDAAEADARRYRWLVDKFGTTKLPCMLEAGIPSDYIADGKESIDAAIDTALTQGA